MVQQVRPIVSQTWGFEIGSQHPPKKTDIFINTCDPTGIKGDRKIGAAC